ncbi:MAG: hypothetical protein AB7O80_05695 [Acetobacteraceae bacterium]
MLLTIGALVLAGLGDALDPAWAGEVAPEFGLLEGGGEAALLSVGEWPLIGLLFMGWTMGLRHRSVRRSGMWCMPRLCAADRLGPDKVPI